MGSRILSRSFQVSKWEDEGEDGISDESHSAVQANVSTDSAAMDVDELEPDGEVNTETAEEDSDEDADEDDPADVAMVPMADMLNAQFESENVCVILFIVVKKLFTFISRSYSMKNTI